MPDEAKRGIVIPLSYMDSVEDAVSMALDAENDGFGFVSIGETAGWSVPPILSVIADRTKHIGITDEVLSPYSRTPTTLGQTAVSLQDLSDGRFRLRLGTSSPALAENWHGMDFDKPLRRLRESIEIIQQVQRGQSLEYNGEVFQINGLQLECPPPAEPAPIDVASFGPKATELAGRFADGWVPMFLPYEALKNRLIDLKTGADEGDRSIEDIRVVPVIQSCVNENSAIARQYAKAEIAFTVAVYGPFYYRAISNAGWAGEADKIRTLWREGNREDAIDSVPSELLDDLVAAGKPGTVIKQIERFESLPGVDTVGIAFFNSMNANERSETMNVLSP